MPALVALQSLPVARFETPTILKKLASSSRHLAELKGVAVSIPNAIGAALLDLKHRIRKQHPRIYSQDLINNLFQHPYTKIEFIERDLQVSRLTASKYLEALTKSGFLVKRKMGRSNYYINKALTAILTA